MAAKRKWIQRIGIKRGALRRQLGLPERGGPIPRAKLEWAAKQPGKLGKRARLALMLRGFGRRKKHRGGR